MSLIDFAESGWMPDFLLRMGIRRLLARRLRESVIDENTSLAVFADRLRESPLAIATDAANEQHYEVPPAFFQKVLGPRLKYSACEFDSPRSSLADAEVQMLRTTCQRAELADGMKILELGCGWGSLSLWMAEQFPASSITAVSNSAPQREFIMNRAQTLGLNNLNIITNDMRDFDTPHKFDRVVSVEMFEHMRNYEELLRRVASWLKDDGKVFVHIFCNRRQPYLFETEGAANWMGRHFFTGGMMPSSNLMYEFSRDLTVAEQWKVNGMHYWYTCQAWLQNLDQNYSELVDLLAQDLPRKEAKRNLQRWRMFFMACGELFRYQGGDEWYVAHYLMQKTPLRGDTSLDNSDSLQTV